MLLRSNKCICLSIFFLFIAVLIACESPTGEQGEQGEQGEPGESIEMSIITGILPTGLDYWWIELEYNIENSIIIVHVRESSDYSWYQPIWTFSGRTVFIFESGFVKAGFEYRILIAK